MTRLPVWWGADVLELPERMLEALEGSRAGDRVVAEAWYDGELVEPDLQLASWSIDEDATRAVRQQVSLVVLSEDGRLAPWALDDPLGVGGARVRLTYLMPAVGEQLLLGEFRIRRSSVDETWTVRPLVTAISEEDGRPTAWREHWSSSATVDVQADDLTMQVQLERFLGPESAEVTSSVVGEVRRLLDGIVPVRVLPGVQDGAVPSSVTYDRERLDVVVKLLESIEATHRMAPDGVLEVLPIEPGAPVWQLAAGARGLWVGLGREMAADDFSNVAVVEGRTADDRPLVGVAQENGGALRVDGPHGRVPNFLSSDLMNTQAKVNRAAATRLSSLIAERVAVLPVTCLPHPGLQAGDVVTLSTPVGELSGPVLTRTLSGSDAGVDDMSLTMAVAWEELQVIGIRLRQGRSS